MIKSQDELNTCNDGHRSSDVLLQTIEKCGELEKENHELQVALNKIYNLNPGYYGIDIFMKCQEIAKKALTRINAVIGESEE